MPQQPNPHTRNVQRAGAPASTEELMGRREPQALEVERYVLGGILIEPNVYGEIAELLRPETFYDKKHQLIYQAIMQLAQVSSPIDFLTVGQQLQKNGVLEEAGGQNYISQLTVDVASAAHIEYHAQLLSNKSLARQLITLGRSIEERAFDETTDVEELMNSVENDIFQISQQSQKKDVQEIGDLLQEAQDRLRRAADLSADGVTGVPSGFKDLDKVTSGWQRSDLIIIAARPAMGKTAFVLSMAKNMGMMNHPVAVFSLEMSNIQLLNRIIMNLCSIEGSKLRNGSLTNEDWSAFDHYAPQLMKAPIYVDDTPGLSIFELRSKARRLVREKHVECIIIDYLQLMTAGQKMQSREIEVSTISRSLKGLAKELDIPIIALSQLNRGVEGRTGVEGKVPQLSDLRESGAIEQDADMVCFIHRPEYYFGKGVDAMENADEKGKGHIIIAKHRNGATADVKLKFVGQYTRFADDDDSTSGPDSGMNYTTHTSRLGGGMASVSSEGYAPVTPGDYGTGYAPSSPLSEMQIDSSNEAPF